MISIQKACAAMTVTAASLFCAGTSLASGTAVRFSSAVVDPNFNSGAPLVAGDSWAHWTSSATYPGTDNAQKGKLTLGGSFASFGTRKPLVSRLNWNGSADTSFGPFHSGVTTPAYPAGSAPTDDEVASVVVGTDNSVFALITKPGPAGSPPLTRNAYVVHFSAAGTFDATWGPSNDGFLQLADLGLKPVMKLNGSSLWIAGSTAVGTDRKVRVWQIDMTTGRTGLCTSSFDSLPSSPDVSAVFDMAIDPSGRLLVAGSTNDVGRMIRIGTSPLTLNGGVCNVDTTLRSNMSSVWWTAPGLRATGVTVDSQGRILIVQSFPPNMSQTWPGPIAWLDRFSENGSIHDAYDYQDMNNFTQLTKDTSEISWRIVPVGNDFYIGANVRGLSARGFELVKFLGSTMAPDPTFGGTTSGSVHIFIPGMDVNVGAMSLDTSTIIPRPILVGTAVPVQ